MATPNTRTGGERVPRVPLPQPDRRSSGAGPLRRILRLMGVLAVLAWQIGPSLGSAADLEAGRRKAEVCTACHGSEGNSTNPAIPSLAGQPSMYAYYQLLQFRAGQRVDPQMSAVAASLSDADMQDLAAYYASQTPVLPRGAGEPEKLAAGRRLVQAHHCDSCHVPGLVGQQHIPRLAGQHYDYLLKQLHAFKAQTRTDMEGSMTMAAQPLSAEDIETLAYFISHLGAEP